MTSMDRAKLVELYGRYKRDRVAEANLDLYDIVLSVVVRELPRIVDPGAAIDYIDHIVDVLRWKADDQDAIMADLQDFLEFYW